MKRRLDESLQPPGRRSRRRRHLPRPATANISTIAPARRGSRTRPRRRPDRPPRRGNQPNRRELLRRRPNSRSCRSSSSTFYIFLCVVAFLVVTIGVGCRRRLDDRADRRPRGRRGGRRVPRRESRSSRSPGSTITEAAGPMLQAVEDADRLADRSTHWVEDTTKKFRA